VAWNWPGSGRDDGRERPGPHRAACAYDRVVQGTNQANPAIGRHFDQWY